MPPLPPNIMQGRWLRWWLTLSFAVMFSGTFLFNSRIGFLNVLDVLFFLLLFEFPELLFQFFVGHLQGGHSSADLPLCLFRSFGNRLSDVLHSQPERFTVLRFRDV